MVKGLLGDAEYLEHIGFNSYGPPAGTELGDLSIHGERDNNCDCEMGVRDGGTSEERFRRSAYLRGFHWVKLGHLSQVTRMRKALHVNASCVPGFDTKVAFNSTRCVHATD